jgi:flagellar protein FlaG
MPDIAPPAPLPAGLAPARTMPAPVPAPATPAFPADPATLAARAPSRTPHALQQQLEALAEPAHTRLRFRVEEDLGCIAVSVIDERSGEVILQVPSETALRIARRLRENGGVLDEHA